MSSNVGSEAPDPARNDRRSEVRTATVFKPVLIETDEFAGFCLVRNLSANGMMGLVYASFAEAQPVTLHFGSDITVSGALLWCKDGRVGVHFDHNIDVDALLAEMATKVVQGRINRAPRLDMRCEAELIIGDRTLKVQMQDISQRGIKACASFIQPGDEVQVAIKGLEGRKAIVRWTQNGTAGLNFLRPLPFDELARWAVQQQADRFPDLSRTPTYMSGI